MLHQDVSFHLNPNPRIVREKSCLDTIAKVIPQLVFNAEGEQAFHPVDSRVSYAWDNQKSDREADLCFRVDEASNAIILVLKNLLSNYFRENPLVFGVDANAIMIPHDYIPRFLNEICRAVSLYKEGHYSLVRDFYHVGPEAVVHQSLDEQTKIILQDKFNKRHKAYRSTPRMQGMLSTALHYANGGGISAPLFKKVHHAVSSELEIYERLNALVHAYHLGDKPAGVKISDSFENRLKESDNRPRLAETYGDLLTIIHHGDMFYEISDAFLAQPDIQLAYVSPDNLFRCGSAALTGNRGTVEESLARVSNYVPTALAQAELHADDPQRVLCSLYQNLQPTGKTLKLSSACGIYYLSGQTIPEYIKRADAKAYSEFAYERLHLAREMAYEAQNPVTTQYAENRLLESSEESTGYEDKYPAHKKEPHRVDGVKFLDACGVVRDVSVVGMVGLDGKVGPRGSIAARVSFQDIDQHTMQGRDEQGRFSLTKAAQFYESQWARAFQSVLESNVKLFILNPVGCGVFDPSSDGSTYTLASAQGFAKALQAMLPDLMKADIKLILPIYDMKKVYRHYQAEIKKQFENDPVIKVIGGTDEFCVSTISQKYRELGGKQYEIEGKSLDEILAHAFQKDRKTRQALIALKYLKLDEHHQLVIGDLAPQPVHDSFERISNAASQCRVRELIIEEYKKQRGWFYKSNERKSVMFDIFSATLEDMVKRALEKEGTTRRTLINLGYFQRQQQPASTMLVLNDHGVPPCIRDLYEKNTHAPRVKAAPN